MSRETRGKLFGCWKISIPLIPSKVDHINDKAKRKHVFTIDVPLKR